MKSVHEVGTSVRRVLAGVLVPLGLIAASLAVGATAPAAACSCVALDLPSLAKQGDAVFVGTPIATDEADGRRTYEVRVSDVYKGGADSTTIVTTEEQASACGVDLELDKQYLVVGDRGDSEGTITTSACSGTQPISDRVIADVEKAFGPATPYRGPAGDTGGDSHQGDNGTDPSQDAGPGNGDSGGTGGGDATEASTSDDGMDASYVVVGGVLLVALGASFLVPRLRRRNRSDT